MYIYTTLHSNCSLQLGLGRKEGNEGPWEKPNDVPWLHYLGKAASPDII